jgi:hypothetical protein
MLPGVLTGVLPVTVGAADYETNNQSLYLMVAAVNSPYLTRPSGWNLAMLLERSSAWNPLCTCNTVIPVI